MRWRDANVRPVCHGASHHGKFISTLVIRDAYGRVVKTKCVGKVDLGGDWRCEV